MTARNVRTRIGGLAIGVAAIAGWALFSAAPAKAAVFTDEAAWRAAAGGVYALETFDGIPAGTDITSLPALGIKFDPLDDGTQPTVQPYSFTGGDQKSAPNDLLNDRDDTLPARGPYTIRPIDPSDFIYGLGLWNVGIDDTLRLTYYDASDNIIDQVTSPSAFGFFGIFDTNGAKKAVIDFVGGNGYAPVDNFQTAVRLTPAPVPAPGALPLLGSALAALGLLRRKRTA